MPDKPALYMIAGPNGAGKTTTALKLLPDFLSIHEFVNADEIARGLNPLGPDGQAIAAGRLMLQRIETLLQQRKSFAFETTGASRSFVNVLQRAKAAGYEVGLLFIWLPSSDLARKRVGFRVALGGHHIPDADVERRYDRSLSNLFQLYMPLVDTIQIVDNSATEDKIMNDMIAEFGNGLWTIYKQEIWETIRQCGKQNAENR